MNPKSIISLIAVTALGYLWYKYIKQGPIYRSDKTLHGKVALITGGNNGIGKEIAKDFARRGATTIIASRNVKKSEKVKEDIIKESGNTKVYAMQLDLSDFGSVRHFVEEFEKSEQHLDFLVNNAGATAPGVTESGLNKAFVINYLGPFLLTNLLVGKMKSQAAKRHVRIINLTSEMYRLGTITEEVMYFNATSDFEIYRAYGNSKLAILYFTRELHKRLNDFGITSYAVNPGFIATGIGDNFSLLHSVVMAIPNLLFQKSAVYGSQTAMYCALDDDVIHHSGGYFDDCATGQLAGEALKEGVADFLWEESEKLTGLVQ